MKLYTTFNIYITRQFIFWLLMTTLVFSIVILLGEFIELSKKTSQSGNISMGIVFRIVFLKLPSVINQILPFIFLISSLVCFWLINGRQEIIAIRSFGQSIWATVSGCITASFLLATFNTFALNTVSTKLLRKSDYLVNKIYKNRDSAVKFSHTGIWFRESTRAKSIIIHAEKLNFNTKIFDKVSFFETDSAGIFYRRIFMPTAKLMDGYWIAENAKITYYDGDQFNQSIRYPTNLTVEKLKNGYIQPNKLNFWELSRYTNLLEASGLSTIKYDMVLQTSIANILLITAMVLFAAAFTLHPTRYKDTTQLIIMAVLFGFATFITTDMIYALGMGGHTPVLLAAWSPAVIALFISISMLIHIEIK